MTQTKDNNAQMAAQSSNEIDNESLPKILFLTTYPPIECGIATYTRDLINALRSVYSQSFEVVICPIEKLTNSIKYEDNIYSKLNYNNPSCFTDLATKINHDKSIELIVIQHEFGLYNENEKALLYFLHTVTKPKAIVFHTILPNPSPELKSHVGLLAYLCQEVIVMTKSSADILNLDYNLSTENIQIIRHGTHSPGSDNAETLKSKYNLVGNKVLSTFGLLSSGKSIETSIKGLPEIITKHNDVVFLIIGKTHPDVFKNEGNKYLDYLKQLVKDLELREHVQFVTDFLGVEQLLEYLNLSDVYLFTTNDPNQAVSGTFSYAYGCGCPIVSTPIPQALECLNKNDGCIVDFNSSEQLSKAVIKLLDNEEERLRIKALRLEASQSSSWTNIAILFMNKLQKHLPSSFELEYKIPPFNWNHMNNMTTKYGIYQFAKGNEPNKEYGYTLDDNARGLIVYCMEFKNNKSTSVLDKIRLQLDFISYCQTDSGSFYNYLDENKQFTKQNTNENLEDSNGRAIWALGYLISLGDILPLSLLKDADKILQYALNSVDDIHSPRSMAFIIKGLFYRRQYNDFKDYDEIIDLFAGRLMTLYSQSSDANWHWFENKLTYANTVLSEALLLAYLVSFRYSYLVVAEKSLDFILKITIQGKKISVIPNGKWMSKDSPYELEGEGGEQPIDVAYTMITLNQFHKSFPRDGYDKLIKIAFSWFLGNNALNQVVYNSSTGGCFDGLEIDRVNQNQGAESTLCYFLSRFIMEESTKNRNQSKGFQFAIKTD